MQTAITLYSQTESYYLFLESWQMEGGLSHPFPLSLFLPFLCKANLQGRVSEDEDIMVREVREGVSGE